MDTKQYMIDWLIKIENRVIKHENCQDPTFIQMEFQKKKKITNRINKKLSN